ncbi:translation initiation factor IF3-2, chloroplastic-like [Tasmannia lanceolata]|uniref:translation initiation factor IF3-2, chloroplastic-like n=1 Tax=Tasmannia lanceolata TaxID=3420 RepID=UPI0040647994
MAGITSFPLKPTLRRRRTTATPSSQSPIDSKLCICRIRLLNNPNFTSIYCVRSVSASTPRSSITARFGGGIRPNQGDSRRSRERETRRAESDLDPALDISSVRSPSVRLIDGQQNMIGVVSKSEAIRMAEDAELDLVILSPDADPPVVKIMDYNKYRYEQQKKKREQQKRTAASRMDIKEVKMGYNIDSHDYSVRLRAAQKFLKDGDKVKIVANLKGRENEFRNIAIELVKRFQNDIGELATEESKSFRDKSIFIVLIPNKAAPPKAQEQPKKKEKPVTEVSAGV